MPDKPSSQKPAADSANAPADAARPRLALKRPAAKAAPAPAAPTRAPARAPAPAGNARPKPAGFGGKPAFEPKPRANTWTAPANGASAARQAPPVIRKEPTDKIRLNKRMADQGMCSRREADDWIANGWVRVNGMVAEMGLQVGPEDRIEVDRAAQGKQEQQVTILLHKPMGYVSGQAEDGHTPAVALINPRTHWRDDTSRNRFTPTQLRGIAPCGRLDIDSVGLLVLTQDGRIARQLIGESSSVDKEYLVRVIYEDREKDVRSVFPEDKLALLNHGLSLDGQPLKPAKVDWQNPEQLRFVLVEGKKRQIRRMCEQVGLKVVGLKRIRIGKITLGNLPVGQWRYLGPNERFE